MHFRASVRVRDVLTLHLVVSSFVVVPIKVRLLRREQLKVYYGALQSVGRDR